MPSYPRYCSTHTNLESDLSPELIGYYLLGLENGYVDLDDDGALKVVLTSGIFNEQPLARGVVMLLQISQLEDGDALRIILLEVPDGFHDGLKNFNDKLEVCKKRIDILLTMAKSIGAWMLSFLATLKDSPWFPATAQNCSTPLELMVVSGPANVNVRLECRGSD